MITINIDILAILKNHMVAENDKRVYFLILFHFPYYVLNIESLVYHFDVLFHLKM